MEFITQYKAVSFTNKTLDKASKRIFKLSNAIRKNAFEVAAIMAQVEKEKAYEEDGFKNVHEWAMQTFSFKKSASYALLKIGREFTDTIHDENGKVTGYGSNLIYDEDRDFTISQVEKMLPAGHDVVVELVESEVITPEMTCKEIEKAIKEATKEVTEKDENAGENESDCATVIEDTPDTDIVKVWDESGKVYLIPRDVLAGYEVKDNV